MGRWVQSRRLISDSQLGILLLILGFVASGALIVFLAYPLAREKRTNTASKQRPIVCASGPCLRSLPEAFYFSFCTSGLQNIFSLFLWSGGSILDRRDEVSLLGGDGNIPSIRSLLSARRDSMRRARHKKPSRLLRPALLVWFEVRITRVSVPKSA